MRERKACSRRAGSLSIWLLLASWLYPAAAIKAQSAAPQHNNSAHLNAQPPIADRPDFYRLHGVRAPQVKPSPQALRLLAELDRLRQQLRERAQTVTLEQAMELSLLQNPDLASAYRQIQADEWNLIAVRRQWYPQINALARGPAGNLVGTSGNVTRVISSNEPNFQPFSRVSSATGVSPGLQLSWTFFNPSRGPSINSASESLRSQRLLFDVTSRNLVLEAQLRYFNLQEKLQLMRSYEEILKATNGEVERTEALFNSGAASIVDVEQIRTQQYQNLSLLISTYAQLVSAAAALAETMALPPGSLALPREQLTPVGAWELSQPDTIRQALALREEIQASLAQSQSARWTATQLFNQYWPRFALGTSGSYSRLDTSTGARGAGLNESQQSWDGGVGIGFSWSLFDGGISAAEAQSSQALARQLQARAARQELLVTREVEDAFANYRASQLSMQSSSEQLSAARQALGAMRERFMVGYADMTSVIQTLNQSISAANAHARSQLDYNSAVVSLYRFSARWPDGVLPVLKQRVNALKR